MNVNLNKTVCIILGLIFLFAGGVTFFVITNGSHKKLVDQKPAMESPKKPVEPVIPKKLQIVDVDSKTRPYAVMINNHESAREHHAGLEKAYLVYEIVVEGGLTRLMALFKDQNMNRIGSVRSARHYYLDYALENDAIYVHFGWSPQARNDISVWGVSNINGLTDSSFFRDTSLNIAYEHTAFTSIPLLKELSKQRGYLRDTNKDLLFQYSIDEIDLSKKEGAIPANQVSIDYSYSMNTSYQYDVERKEYKRVVNGEAHMSLNETTGKKEQLTAKNIIITPMRNYDMGAGKGRQDIDNIGSGDGYFISNGYAVPIQWFKSSRDSQTIYQYLDGTEITLNDGVTYVQISPIGENLQITT